MSVIPPSSKSLGNAGRPKNGFNRTPSTGELVHQRHHTQNGRNTSSSGSASGSMASVSEGSTVLERDEVQEAGASCLPYDYGVQHTKFVDRKTRPIIRLIFCKLCPACSKDLAKVERDIARMEQGGDKDLVHFVVDTTVKLLTDWNMIKTNLDDFHRHNWNVYDGNMYTEFSKVAYEQFSGTVSWGRFIMFIGFSVSFCTYALDRDVPVAANTVMEWTCQVVEEDLAKFFLSNGGWVSDVCVCVCVREQEICELDN